jgi:hypothetical protein
MERDLLNRIDGTRTVGELEAWLLGHGGQELSPGGLTALLAATIERCG